MLIGLSGGKIELHIGSRESQQVYNVFQQLNLQVRVLHAAGISPHACSNQRETRFRLRRRRSVSPESV